MVDEFVFREGEFEWKILNFWKKKNDKKSKAFTVGTYECYLTVGRLDDFYDSECFNVCLLGNLVNYKKPCKLCLIDGRGQEFSVAKRTTLKFETYCELMNIMVSDLDCVEFDLLPKGVLTLRLSWCDEENITYKRDTQAAASDLNPEKEQRKMLQKLSEDFGRIYESEEATDIALGVGSDVMHVHRAMLLARSNVFADMLRQDKSKDLRIVDIPDVDASVFSDVLYYVYSGKTRGMSDDTIVPMYEVAKKYTLIELMEACLNVFMRSLTVENVCDAALLAHNHGETELEEKIVQFVKVKWDEIKQTHKWQELLKSKPSLTDKLIPST